MRAGTPAGVATGLRVATVIGTPIRHHGIDRAYLFGSVIKLGRFHDASDVDLGVEEINSVKQIDAIADLSMALL